MLDPRSTSCFGKAVYFSKKKVKQVRRDCESLRPETPLRYYQCPDCGFWHLTSTPLKRELAPMSAFLTFILTEMTAEQFAVLVADWPGGAELGLLAWEREQTKRGVSGCHTACG